MIKLRTTLITILAFASFLSSEARAQEQNLEDMMVAEASEVSEAVGAIGPEEGMLVAQTSGTRRARKVRRKAGAPKSTKAELKDTVSRPTAAPKNDANMSRARKLISNNQFQEASRLLFQMSRSPQYERDAAQIKYLLGLTLGELNMNQAAAFVFYDVIRQESRQNARSPHIRKSLERLALAADQLDSDVLLRYAIKQVDENDFPAANRDMLYFRTGEVRMQEKDYIEAAKQFARVRSNSLFFTRARYNLALALAEGKELEKAQAAFEDLADRTKDLGVTDRTRVSALIGRARVLYQRQMFGAALEAYREVPRDTEHWHEALFESSWAMLRDGRFRSALSNFHSLHSSYYDDVYQPESLLLRAIVYLYICRNDEMKKVLDLFEKQYKPVARDIKDILNSANDPVTYYRELAKVNDNFESIRNGKANRRGYQIPFVVAREILSQGDVRRTFSYIKKLEGEKKRFDSMPSQWKTSGVGVYARKIVDKRLESTHVLAGKQIRRHLILIQNELRDLQEQSGFLRFEMISSARQAKSKEIQGKGLKKTVDEETARDYFIQNGYEYWPFTGEYWLDEIGNYHYVGVNSCE